MCLYCLPCCQMNIFFYYIFNLFFFLKNGKPCSWQKTPCVQKYASSSGGGGGTPNPGMASPPRGVVTLLPCLSSFHVLLAETVPHSLICSLPFFSPCTIHFNQTTVHGSQRSLAWLRLHPWQQCKLVQLFWKGSWQCSLHLKTSKSSHPLAQ